MPLVPVGNTILEVLSKYPIFVVDITIFQAHVIFRNINCGIAPKM